ncbi:MAG TPA: acetate--CoA ligase family protein [Nocardioidaceae bacterium]|nr:acetate--CoA ligase family protein [Nocardioidaceae bacterium]
MRGQPPTGDAGATGTHVGLEGADGIAALFQPRVVAVVGVSRTSVKWGNRILQHTLDAGFTGRIYGINPTAGAGEEVAGVPLVPSIDEIPGPIDLAVLAVRRDLAEQAMREVARVGVGVAVVTASGFGELGAEGLAAEARLRDIAAAAGTRLLGPNGFGVFSADDRLNLTPRSPIAPGPLALASQSGNVAVALFQQAAAVRLGFSRCVGVGNQSDIGFGELLEYFASDRQTRAVGLYVEGLRADDGAGFRAGLEACRRAGKPVAVLKSGSSAVGARSVQTHTHALTSDDTVWATVLGAHGAVRVGSAEELVDVLQAAVRVPWFSGGVAVATDGGGDTVMAVDALAEVGLPLATLTDAARDRVHAVAPPLAPPSPGGNPVTLDTPGGVQDNPGILASCAEAFASAPDVGVVVLGGVFGGYALQQPAELSTARALVELHLGRIPVVVQSSHVISRSDPLLLLADGGVAIYPTVQRLAAALATRHRTSSGARVPNRAPRRAGATVSALDPDELRALLRAGGIDLPGQVRIPPGEGWRGDIDAIDFPVAVKLSDPAVAHKSEVDGVRLDVADKRQLEEVVGDLRRRFPASPLVVMHSYPAGLELLVGGFTDPVFGPVVLLGRGGIWTEAEDDVALCAAPVTRASVRNALQTLRCHPILAGGRGQPPLAIGRVVDLALSVASVLSAHPTLTLDLNPVILYADGCAVVDVYGTVGEGGVPAAPDGPGTAPSGTKEGM